MQKRTASKIDYVLEVAKIVAAMPRDRAAEVYDFAQFILQKSDARTDLDAAGDDWLNDSSERIAAEEAVWQKSYAKNPDKLKAIVREARSEYETGKTKPLFKSSGEVNLS